MRWLRYIAGERTASCGSEVDFSPWLREATGNGKAPKMQKKCLMTMATALQMLPWTLVARQQQLLSPHLNGQKDILLYFSGAKNLKAHFAVIVPNRISPSLAT